MDDLADGEDSDALMPRPPTSVCTTCRVLIDEGLDCEQSGRHVVAPLATRRGRRARADEVWSAPRMKLLATPESRLVAGVALLAAFMVAILSASPVISALLIFIPLVASPLVILGLRALMSMSGKRLPRGTPARVLLPPPSRRAKAMRGQIRSTTILTAPLTGRQCVGYTIVLRCDEYIGGDVMLSHSEAVECDIDLEDGRSIRVPAGRIRLEVPDLQRVADKQLAHELLSRIDPIFESYDESIPFDHALEGILEPGDRVAVFGKTTDVPMSYREPGRNMLLRGIPRIQVIE